MLNVSKNAGIDIYHYSLLSQTQTLNVESFNNFSLKQEQLLNLNCKLLLS